MAQTNSIIIKFFKWVVPKETSILDNKNNILKLLFSSEFQTLSTKESIDLFKDVESDFNKELSKRYINAQIEIADIDEYNKSKKL
jgi:hypothetical protein